MRRSFGADGDFARFDAAMAFFERFRPLKIRRRPVVTTPRVRGGKIAERLGDPGFQSGLIVLDCEEVMAVAVTDMTADLALGENRVACDDATLKRQSFQQDERGGDFVLIGFDGQFADDSPQLRRKGRQDMNGFIVQVTAAAQRLAVNSDVLGLAALAKTGPASGSTHRHRGIERNNDMSHAGRFAGLDTEQAKRLGLWRPQRKIAIKSLRPPALPQEKSQHRPKGILPPLRPRRSSISFKASQSVRILVKASSPCRRLLDRI